MDYRRDIDGLRAFAVIGVVAFHLDPSWLPGGFVGVDAFFVISGFLITTQVSSALASSRFSLAEFYSRRLRRLFPAAFVTTLLTAIAAPFVLPRTLLPEFWGSALFSGISLANVFFWKHSSYFDGDALTKPLLHMWSLGVEEQFYLVWPSLLVIVARFVPRKNLHAAVLLVVTALGGVSLWRCQEALGGNASSAFYFTHLRAWEFAMGGIVSFVLVRRKPGVVVGHLAFVAGAALLAASAIALSVETPFPGFWAIPPCLGTALIIFANRPRLADWLLGNPVAIGIGKISYSVYLVHWPLIVFAAASRGSLDLRWKLGLGAASLAIGTLMWRGVEQTLRRPRADGRGLSRAGFALACAALALGCTAASGTLWSNPWSPARKATERNARMMEFLNAQNAWTKQFNSGDNCYVSSGAIYPEKQCMRASAATDGGKPDVLVIGDSLAANLSTGMSAYWADAVNVDLAASPGCRPIFAATKTGPSCGSVTNVVFEKADLSHYELVILHGNFARPAHVEAIVPSIAKLRARGATDIVLLGPNVEYKSSVLDVLSKNESASHDVVTAELTALILLRNFAQEPHMQKAADAAKIKYVSLLKLRCPSGTSESCMHTMGADGDPITRDNIHLSRTSSVWTLSLVEQRVAPWKGLLKFRSPNAWP